MNKDLLNRFEANDGENVQCDGCEHHEWNPLSDR